jgi:hypothetical protein
LVPLSVTCARTDWTLNAALQTSAATKGNNFGGIILISGFSFVIGSDGKRVVAG